MGLPGKIGYEIKKTKRTRTGTETRTRTSNTNVHYVAGCKKAKFF